VTITPVQLITKQMNMIFHGNHWHASIKDLLQSISPEVAAKRPTQGGHTIYEIVHHLAYSAEEIVSRLQGNPGRWEEEQSWVACMAKRQ
jgi:uncharacterized damage-inducible protein DinB